jgi:ABC-type nitrate/sulfonate/bicarbonate transport system permease component
MSIINFFKQFRRLDLLIILLAVWEYASRFILDKTESTLLPPPSGVARWGFELMQSGEI